MRTEGSPRGLARPIGRHRRPLSGGARPGRFGTPDGRSRCGFDQSREGSQEQIRSIGQGQSEAPDRWQEISAVGQGSRETQRKLQGLSGQEGGSVECSEGCGTQLSESVMTTWAVARRKGRPPRCQKCYRKSIPRRVGPRQRKTQSPRVVKALASGVVIRSGALALLIAGQWVAFSLAKLMMGDYS
jgi:hypothetical protein